VLGHALFSAPERPMVGPSVRVLLCSRWRCVCRQRTALSSGCLLRTGSYLQGVTPHVPPHGGRDGNGFRQREWSMSRSADQSFSSKKPPAYRKARPLVEWVGWSVGNRGAGMT
jgi:hypothetical protein